MIIGDSKKHATAILALKAKPETSGETEDRSEEEGSGDDMAALEACAQDCMDAFIKRDVKALAMAMKDFFETADSMPHEEGPHPEEEPAEGDMFPKKLI